MTDMDQERPDLAVALNYDGENAPRLTAKGQDELAKRIVELAKEHAVPLHQDPQLAAVLAQIPLGEEIPEALYRAVAEVIAFAYMISGKRPPGYEEV
jgi:flagellar biosynthesis protein